MFASFPQGYEYIRILSRILFLAVFFCGCPFLMTKRYSLTNVAQHKHGALHQVRHECDSQVLYGLRLTGADDDCAVLWMRRGYGRWPEVLHPVREAAEGGWSGLQLWSCASAGCQVLHGLRQARSIGLFEVRSCATAGCQVLH